MPITGSNRLAATNPWTNHQHAEGDRALRLLQLTDLHLFADADGELLGQNTSRTLELVIELASIRHWPPDALLLTGDLVHDETGAGYRLLRERLDQLQVPAYCIPGNHDRRGLLAEHLDPAADTDLRIVALGAWRLALLDSTIPEEDGGHLAPEALRSLDAHLAAHPGEPTLICLHHQPVPVGSPWMDEMMVDNGADLLGIAERYPSVRGILWGHVHQEFRHRHRDMHLLATPSTCIQFMPGSDTFTLDPQRPGYRWLELQPDGRIATGIERIDAYPAPLEHHSYGY